MQEKHYQNEGEEKYLQEILRISANDVMIIIYCHLILWYFFEINLNDAIETCRFTIYDFMKINIENIFSMCIFNFIMVVVFLT